MAERHPVSNTMKKWAKAVIAGLPNTGWRLNTAWFALNNLADNYVDIQNGRDSMDKMLRQIFFGNQNNNTYEA